MTVKKEKKAKKTAKTTDNVLSMYFNEVSRIPLLSREEEDEVAKAAALGNIAARNKLINSNLRFVIKIAKKYQGQGLPLDDLISEGNIGLISAVDRYDSSRGFHFISYAIWWIRQAILKAICEKSRMIRLPMNRVNELIRIVNASKLTQEQGGEGEIKEIASFLNMDKDLVHELVCISKDMVSLENPVTNAQDSSVLGDFIEDERVQSPMQNIIQSDLEKEIEKILNTLDKKEADIIRCRYGLGKHKPMSLKELGEHMNLTKERVRQIEKTAVSRLQHPARLQLLQSYVA
jgi:RNA polymerase primary sigma factor